MVAEHGGLRALLGYSIYGQASEDRVGCSTVSEEKKENTVRVGVGGHCLLLLNLLNNSNTLKVIVRLSLVVV